MRNSSVTEEENSTTWRRQDGKPMKKLLCNTLWQREQRRSSESGSSLESDSCESQDEERDTRANSSSASDVTEAPTQAQRLLKTQIDGIHTCLHKLQHTPGRRDAATKAATSDAVPSCPPGCLSEPTPEHRTEPSKFTEAHKALDGFKNLALSVSGLDSGLNFREASRFLSDLQAELPGLYRSPDSPDLFKAFCELDASVATLHYTTLRLTLGDTLESTDSVEELHAVSYELDQMIECCTPGEVLQALTGINFGQTTQPRSPLRSVQPVLIWPSVVPQFTSRSMGSCSTEHRKHSGITTVSFREHTKRPRTDTLTHVSAAAAFDEDGQSTIWKKRRTKSPALL